MLITLGEGDKALKCFRKIRTTRVLRIRNRKFILACTLNQDKDGERVA